MKLENLVCGHWIAGDGDGQWLHNAITGAQVACASTAGIDIESMYTYARNTGAPNLARMTFHQRGRMLKALALYLDFL